MAGHAGSHQWSQPPQYFGVLSVEQLRIFGSACLKPSDVFTLDGFVPTYRLSDASQNQRHHARTDRDNYISNATVTGKANATADVAIL
jgi:hypothetical protein